VTQVAVILFDITKSTSSKMFLEERERRRENFLCRIEASSHTN
jgi:hypothetical protein